MKAEILKLLRESGDYVSGQRLCEEFGVSRTAVWKVIRQLKEEGYHVEAVKNRGYRIVEIPDVLSREELESLLAGKTRCSGGAAECRKGPAGPGMGIAPRVQHLYVRPVKAKVPAGKGADDDPGDGV